MKKNNKKFAPKILFGLLAFVYLPIVVAIDTDGDSIQDELDNCTEVPNIEQRDTDKDGFGNRCDGDFNNDCIVDFVDYTIFGAYLNTSLSDFDLNVDGDVNYIDLKLFGNLFFIQPGPSASTTIDCSTVP